MDADKTFVHLCKLESRKLYRAYNPSDETAVKEDEEDVATGDGREEELEELDATE